MIYAIHHETHYNYPREVSISHNLVHLTPRECSWQSCLSHELRVSVPPAVMSAQTDTGKTSTVFSCFNQDQELDSVDFGALSERLKQNSLQEKITAQWILHCMPELRKQRTLV